MLKDVIRSLKNDKIRTFFCWLTFTITSLFIFLFFVVAMSKAVGVKMVNGASDIPSILMLTSVIICSIEIVFANDFFVKNKARELAIRLVCGSTYAQNASFLLLQVVVVLVFALPIGIGVALALVPVINTILVNMMNSSTTVSINASSVIWAIAVLGFVIFWTMILNLSFSYRNSASQLLNSNTLKLSKGTTTSVGGNVGKVILKLIHLFIFIAPLFLGYHDTRLLFPCVVASIFGFLYVLDDFIVPMLNKLIHSTMSNSKSLISLGFFRSDISVLRMNLMMNIVSSALLIMLLSMSDKAVYKILILITYICINLLLSLSLLFKYANEITERIGKFKTLSHLGFVDKVKKRIIVKEVFDLYLYLGLMIVLYLIYIFVSYGNVGLVSNAHMIVLALGNVIPHILCGVVILVYYLKTVMKGN